MQNCNIGLTDFKATVFPLGELFSDEMSAEILRARKIQHLSSKDRFAEINRSWILWIRYS